MTPPHTHLLLACAVSLLCFLSEGHGAPGPCQDLVRPVDHVDPRQLEGRWAMVGGSLSDESLMERLRQRDSATASFSSSSLGSGLSFRRSMRMQSEAECHYGSYNVTLQGSSFTFNSVNTTFISTCSDCMLLSFNVESGKRHHLYLFSRRRELQQEELQEFRAQVECLKMPPPAVMDPTKELCPEQTPGSTAS